MIFEQCYLKKKRRKIGLIAILAVTALLLTSCGKAELTDKTKSDSEGTTSFADTTSDPDTGEQKAVTTLNAETGHFYDCYWDNASERIAASITYPYMHLSEEDRKTYPKLEQALVTLMQERKESRQELYEEAVRSAKETPVADPEHPPFYEVKEKVTVRRADSRVFSLILEGVADTGGTHGQPYTIGAVFDTEIGERLKLTDVVTHEGLFFDSVQEQLEAFWDKDYLYEDLNLVRFLQENLDNLAWVLDYYGLSIYFQPYDIAPYASGVQNITIPFASYPELINEKYLEVPKSYGIEFTEEKPFFFDVDGDEKTDSLTVSAAKGADDNYEAQTVTLNGESFKEDTGIYIIEPMLLHTADGKNYLYIGQQYPDDRWVFEVFDLSKGTIERKDIIYSGRHNIIDYEKEYFARQVLSDPDNFLLDTYTQMLGTAYGYDSYRVGADGLPVQEHSWYTICSETEITLLKDLTVSVVGEDGKEVESTELKSGDKALYYRTDGENWADLKLSDGKIVRVNLNNKDGEWTVDGKMLEEVFDGVKYGE